MHKWTNRLRRLMEGLPEPASWAPLIMCSILQTGTYRPFVQQCLENTAILSQLRRRRRRHQFRASEDTLRTNASLLDEILAWERTARIHHWVVTSAYLYFIIKYRALSLIGDKFRYLDCFIPGRFRFMGRTNKISGEIVGVFGVIVILGRWIIYLCEPKFKFYALEFLMSSHTDVLRDEMDATRLGKTPKEPHEHLSVTAKVGSPEYAHIIRERSPVELLEIYGRKTGIRSEWLGRARKKRAPGAGASRPRINSVAYLQVPFNLMGDKWILRPNRTAESWLVLKLCTKFLFYCIVWVMVSSCLIMYYLLAGSVFTNFGFEISYPACVSWLRNIQSIAPGEHAHIYVAPKVLAHEISIDEVPARIPLDTRDFQRANLYGLWRIATDILENQLIYVELLLLFGAYFYMLALHSIDVVLNAQEIKRRLVGLIERLEERMRVCHQLELKLKCYANFMDAQQHNAELANEATGQSAGLALCVDDHTTSGQRPQDQQAPPTKLLELNHGRPEQFDQQLQSDIADLQAIMADHFDTITRGYNGHVSFSLGLMALSWLGYTVVICVWMKIVRSRAIEFEFLLAELSLTFFCLALTSGAALVRSRNLQLYQLVTRAMALDPYWPVTKKRWTTILKFFYPKPFHCFTITESTEVSVLLGLKLISWILSAFIVLANFFYKNRF